MAPDTDGSIEHSSDAVGPDARMTIFVTRAACDVRMVVGGALCADTEHLFNAAVERAASASTGQVVIDLTALTAIDPPGAEALLSARVRCALARVSVSVEAPAPELQAVIEGGRRTAWTSART